MSAAANEWSEIRIPARAAVEPASTAVITATMFGESSAPLRLTSRHSVRFGSTSRWARLVSNQRPLACEARRGEVRNRAETPIPKRNDPPAGRLFAQPVIMAICGRSSAIWALLPKKLREASAYAPGAVTKCLIRALGEALPLTQSFDQSSRGESSSSRGGSAPARSHVTAEISTASSMILASVSSEISARRPPP
jgi:hypothetical protein